MEKGKESLPLGIRQEIEVEVGVPQGVSPANPAQNPDLTSSASHSQSWNHLEPFGNEWNSIPTMQDLL